MNIVYPVIFTETKDEKNTVLVYVPDLDRSTEGYGIADAISMAKDLIGNMLFDVADSNLPKQSSVSEADIGKSPFCEDGESFVSLVDVDLDAFRLREKSRSVRRNITLPEWLDDMAAKAKLNVSAIAQNALRKELGIA